MGIWGFVCGFVAMYLIAGILLHEHHRKVNIQVFGMSLMSFRESITLVFLWIYVIYLEAE